MTLRIADCELRIEKRNNPKSEIRNPKSVRGLIRRLKRRLREAGIAQARVEAEWLLAGAMGLSLTELYLCEELVDPQIENVVVEWLARRIKGEPLHYLVGYTEFCGHRLSVNPSVLIPRPETEVLTERAIRYLQRVIRQGHPSLSASPGTAQAGLRVLDLGTGSANIAISIGQAIPACVVIAVELSWEALQLARANVAHYHVDDRVWLIQADWTSGVDGPFELIVANPPYVPTGELGRLPEEVMGEPRISLDGGPDGMAFHRRLLADAPRLLAPGGAVIVECAEAQARSLVQLVSGQPWVKRVQVFEDLAGRPRGLFIEKRNQ